MHRRAGIIGVAVLDVLETEGVDLVFVGPRVAENDVIIGVQGLTPEIERRLVEEYGPWVTVKEDAPGQLDVGSSPP